MSDLAAEFAQAQTDVKSLSKRPGNADMLEMYSLFKQASSGDAAGKRPGMMDPVGRAKFDAWEKIKGMSADDAMQKYIDKVKALLAADGK